MKFQKSSFSAKYLYHYTTRERARQILEEHTIRCFNDRFTFFTTSHTDAVNVCHNVLKEGALYIDDNLSLCQRAKTDFSDYVILRIQCPTNAEFYHLTLEHPQDTFCAYDYSLMHKGDLHFKKGKILSLDHSISSSCKKAVNKAAVFGGTCLLIGAMWTSSAYAARSGWLDSPGNYDTSWFNSSNADLDLNNAKQLAGLSHLVNQGNNMSGKTIIIHNDIDLSSKKWCTIPSSFAGTIEGAHQIVITLAEGDTFAAGNDLFTKITFNYISVDAFTETPSEIEVSCQHSPEPVLIHDATPDSDALGAEKCTNCGEILKYYDVPGTACASFMENTADSILHATTNNVIVDTSLWTCLDKRITDALLERSNVSLTINYKYQGIRYTVTIPAGTNASELLDENGYCGFRYLDYLYQGTTLTE